VGYAAIGRNNPLLIRSNLIFGMHRQSFRDGNLSFIAMDESEPSRVRIVISAQLNKKSGAYEGQIFVDMGGNQLMLHNGPVRCTIGPK
jgi:hypothetical protein